MKVTKNLGFIDLYNHVHRTAIYNRTVRKDLFFSCKKVILHLVFLELGLCQERLTGEGVTGHCFKSLALLFLYAKKETARVNEACVYHMEPSCPSTDPETLLDRGKMSCKMGDRMQNSSSVANSSSVNTYSLLVSP